jgi:hypothetical protein
MIFMSSLIKLLPSVQKLFGTYTNTMCLVKSRKNAKGAGDRDGFALPHYKGTSRVSINLLLRTRVARVTPRYVN